MVKKRRNKLSRVLYTIPGVATKAHPITQNPLPRSIPGTATQPQAVDASPTVLPLPQSVIENIIGHLHDRQVDLQACYLVSKSWKTRSKGHIFRRVQLTPETVSCWRKHIPPHSAGFPTTLLVVSLLGYDILGPIKDYFISLRSITSLTLRNLNFDDPSSNPGRVSVYFGHLKSGSESLAHINSSGKLLSFTSFFPHVERLTVSLPGDLVPPDPAIGLEYQPL